MDLDLTALRTWIGRSETRSETAAPAVVERFAATFDLPDALAEGDVAPLLIHLCLAMPAAPTAHLDADGHPPRGGLLPPVTLPRRMWAGGSFRFHDDIRIGETVIRHSTLRDVTVKHGRSGRLCFVTVDHRITSAGRLVIEERQDIVYRGEAPPGSAQKAPAAAAPGQHMLVLSPTPTLLFRYSALTFNAHRIHYDQPYTRNGEGYPDLVVQGPLQATLLAHYATRLWGRRPAQFDFRAVSPLFAGADFTLNATRDGDGLNLWTAAAGGAPAMEAQATW